MPLFEDLDRFAVSAQKLRQATTTTSASAGPFTAAALDTQLLDLFRNADESESSLFIRTDSVAAGNLTRKAVTTATPLRRAVKNDVAPEVYLEAALKYIDLYANIKDLSQTRANVQDQLDHTRQMRESIKDMAQQLEKYDNGEAPLPRATLKDEEKRLRQMQLRVAQLTRRRDALKEQIARAQRAAIAHAPGPILNSPSIVEDDDEESFWVPKTSDRVDTGRILDEELDMDEDSIILASSSPLATKRVAAASTPISPPPPPLFNLPVSKTFSVEGCENPGEDEEEESFGDSTIVLEAPPPPPPSTPPSVPQDVLVPPSTARRRNINKVTPETERMVSKIWATMQDIIAPKITEPLNAKDTIVLLEGLSNTAPAQISDDSSVSSSSIAVSSLHQRLCARLLLSLIRAPDHSVPLADLKAELAAAVVAFGITGLDAEGANVKAVFGCVAKKAIRIDRASREQLVKFST